MSIEAKIDELIKALNANTEAVKSFRLGGVSIVEAAGGLPVEEAKETYVAAEKPKKAKKEKPVEVVEPVEEVAEEVEEEKVPEPTVAYEQVREAVVNATKDHGQPFVISVLKEFGLANAKLAKPSQWQDIIDALEKGPSDEELA